ncbi:hypothetical protein ACFV23_31980 [Streptomyces sp. NPDC059627]
MFVDVGLQPRPLHEAGKAPLVGTAPGEVSGERLSLRRLLEVGEPAVLALRRFVHRWYEAIERIAPLERQPFRSGTGTRSEAEDLLHKLHATGRKRGSRPYSERPIARARLAKAQQLVDRMVARGRIRPAEPDDDEAAEWRRIVDWRSGTVWNLSAEASRRLVSAHAGRPRWESPRPTPPFP